MAQVYRRIVPDDSSDDEGPTYRGPPKKTQDKWDAFQEQPPPQETLAYEDKKLYQLAIKILKVLTYLIVFAIVLGSAVLAKITLLLMTSQLKKGTTRRLCFEENNRHRTVEISQLERIQWTWAIFFCFLIPEILSFGRSIRILLFKRVNSYVDEEVPEGEDVEDVLERKLQEKRYQKRTKCLQFFVAAFFEVCHVIGLGLFTFCVLPQVHAVKASMLGNAVCLLPAFLSLLSHYKRNSAQREIVFMVLDALSIVAQIWGIVLWPIFATEESSDMKHSWILPVSAVLTSFGWWENFVSTKSDVGFIQALARIRIGIGQGRYFHYAFISVLKMTTFLAVMCVSVLIMGEDPLHVYFEDFSSAFNTTKMDVTELGLPLANGNTTLSRGDSVIGMHGKIEIENSYHAVQHVLIAQMLAAYLCYITAKFACKICIQEFSFGFPITLSVPLTITLLVSFCGARADKVCFAKDMLPDYLFWTCPQGSFVDNFLSQEHSWIWILLLLSQIWITLHIWFPKSRPLAHTEVLFCTPMYNALLVDQGLALNRKQEVDNPKDALPKKEEEASEQFDPEAMEIFNRNDKWNPDEDPRIYACATMWHETREEMITMLKGVLRMDSHQCCMRLVRSYFEIDVPGYFEFETHIFFDDAFKPIAGKVEGEVDYVINDYVRDLVPAVEESSSQVHECNMRMRVPKIIPTPYGGRMEWTLPGKTRLIVHLKNKDKIRHRKRWSQCMYMYYLLGFLLVDNDNYTPDQKETIAKNTFLLALDGDIDFQPSAVERVLELMRKDEKLGACCGRIHPTGNGPLVWYQKFEYAIGHWLQKATEHVIGCVLCSPGCFSLFRAEALMATNVMKKYTTEPTEARHYVQYDQGEDRWLCTLMLQQGWRVEYCAASDSFTNAPVGFDEFYNQRRRWVPSTMANILDLLQDSKHTVKVNPNISTLYIIYQAVMMAGSILGPGTIFLMLVGAFVAAFKIDNYTSMYINLAPILIFIGLCYYADAKVQLAYARLLSVIYALVMVAVLIALALQIVEDGPAAPSSIFLIAVAASFIIAALVHPLEFDCLIHGIVYYITIPSMYLLLIIYSLFNLNNISWGTRENPVAAVTPKPQAQATQAQAPANKNRLAFLQGIIPGFDQGTDKSQGSMEFSCAGLFKLMCCVTEKPKDETVTILEKLHEDISKQTKELESIKRTLNPMVDARRSSVSSSLSITTTSPLRKDLTSTTSGAFSAQNLLPPTMEETEGEVEDNEEEQEEDIKRDDLINPLWADDSALSNGERDFLTGKELKFWKKFIPKYLQPAPPATDPAEKEKQKRVKQELLALRNMVVGAFFMMNAVFVTALFLLQLNKDQIYINWPFGAKHNFTYEASQDIVRVEAEYLQLEPLGLLFVAFYAVILVVQFVGMMLHRFSTFSQIMASTEIRLFRSARDKDNFTRMILRFIRENGKIKNASVDSDETEKELFRRPTIVGNLMRQAESKQKQPMTIDDVFITKFDKTAKSFLLQKSTSSGPQLDRPSKKSVAINAQPQFMDFLVTRRNTVVERRNSIIERRNSSLDPIGQRRQSNFPNGRKSTLLQDIPRNGEGNSQV